MTILKRRLTGVEEAGSSARTLIASGLEVIDSCAQSEQVFDFTSTVSEPKEDTADMLESWEYGHLDYVTGYSPRSILPRTKHRQPTTWKLQPNISFEALDGPLVSTVHDV